MAKNLPAARGEFPQEEVLWTYFNSVKCETCLDSLDLPDGTTWCHTWMKIIESPDDACQKWEAKTMRDFGPKKKCP